MIIIQLSPIYNTINRISQDIYDSLTTYNKLDSYFKGTEFEEYSFHGHYLRTIIDDNGNEIVLKVLRIRITVVDDEGIPHIQTHAIFFSSMIPYLKYSFNDIVSIINSTIPNDLTISTQVYYFIKSLFKDVVLEYFYSFIQNLYCFIFIHIIST